MCACIYEFECLRNEQSVTETTYDTYDMVNISCFGHLSFLVTNILINMNWRSVMSCHGMSPSPILFIRLHLYARLQRI